MENMSPKIMSTVTVFAFPKRGGELAALKCVLESGWGLSLFNGKGMTQWLKSCCLAEHNA